MAKKTGFDLLMKGIKPSLRYLVTIAGGYFAPDRSGSQVKNYSVSFVTTQELCQGKNPIWQFKYQLADLLMKPNYPDFIELATHELTECLCESGEVKNPDLMNRQELLLLIADLEAKNIDVSLYPDKADLRNVLKDWFELDDEVFESNQEARRKRVGRGYQEKSELLNLQAIDVTQFRAKATEFTEPHPQWNSLVVNAQSAIPEAPSFTGDVTSEPPGYTGRDSGIVMFDGTTGALKKLEPQGPGQILTAVDSTVVDRIMGSEPPLKALPPKPIKAVPVVETEPQPAIGGLPALPPLPPKAK